MLQNQNNFKCSPSCDAGPIIHSHTCNVSAVSRMFCHPNLPPNVYQFDINLTNFMPEFQYPRNDRDKNDVLVFKLNPNITQGHDHDDFQMKLKMYLDQ